MATKRELINRWSSEPGRTILERVHAFFRKTEMPGHGRDSAELFALLDGLPFREEVPRGVDLRGALLGGGTRDLDLHGCHFTYAKLTINLVDCDLSGACFDDVVGGNGILLDRLDGASFARAKLPSTFFRGARARQCCFDQASLFGSSFEGADLSGSSFRDADCRRSRFLRAILIGCDMRGARLDESAFQEVALDGTTDLRGASLVNIFDHDLHDRAGNLVARGTAWRQARLDATTRYGSDPSVSARELIDAALALLENNTAPWTAAAADALRRCRVSEGDDKSWYERVLAAVAPEARPELEAVFADAMRRLL